MIRYNHSNIHDFQNVFLFCGNKKSKEGLYLYEESNFLFGKEVLGPHVIEYEKEDEKDLLFHSDLFQSFLKDIPNDDNRYISIADIRMSQSIDCDILISYEESIFSEISVYSIQSALVQYIKFNVKSQKGFRYPRLFADVDPQIARYLQIEISENFIKDRGYALNPYLEEKFSPERYVDSQIACFMLMTTICGSAQK